MSGRGAWNQNQSDSEGISIRSLAIIFLLLLAVACDADSGDGTEQAATGLAVLATVAELASELDDGAVAIEGAATVSTADATPSAVPETTSTADATPTAVPETTSADDERGVVIDGFCPADVAPERVGPTDDRAKWGNPWGLYGTAYPDRVVLEWGEPPVAGVTSYVVTRHSRYLTDRVSFYDVTGLAPGSVRTFSFDAAPDRREYEDSSEIEPSTEYRYRVFPVTAAGIGFPTAPLEIWSLPANAPSAPLAVNASYYSSGNKTGWNIRANYVFLEPAPGMRVLRRSTGETQWQVRHDETPPVDSFSSRFPGLGYDTWKDEEVDPALDYEYAVCFANTAGFGRAAIVDASSSSITETIAVDPPRDIKAETHPRAVTVYWSPSSDIAVIGYEVERQQFNQDDIYRLPNALRAAMSGGQQFNQDDIYHETTDRMANYVIVRAWSVDTQTKFRVRSVTANGRGPWSEWVGVDIKDTEQPTTAPFKPEIVSSTATHSAVHMVWQTEDSFEGLRARYLRRQPGTEDGDWTYIDCWDWVDLEDWHWDYSCWGHETGFTDEYDVQPNTEYEYAVQVKRGEDVSEVSDPVLVRTNANPNTVERRPLPLYDLDATPTSDGLMLTWELPDDPTLKGILVYPRVADHDNVAGHAPVVLPPDQTGLLVLRRGFLPEPHSYWYDLETFNDFGTQSVGFQRAGMPAADMVHCRAATEEVQRPDVGHHLTIRFRACEETSTQVVRRELTADGFRESRIDQPCAWTSGEVANNHRVNRYFKGTLKCEYDDTSVKPGTWYVYELTQTFADGRVSTTHHEIVTRESW